MSKFYTKFDKPPRVISPHGGISMTDTSFLKETDLNTILRRYNAGDTSVVRPVGGFADVSNLGDFVEMFERVRDARDQFDALPSHIRERFNHDPKALLEFLSDNNNREEAIKLGIIEAPKVERDIASEIVNGVTKALAKPSKEGSVD